MSAERPRVVMLVINPMTADARVHKEAATLARSGYDVTVVATWQEGLRHEERVEGYRILRLPYERTVKQPAVDRRRRERATHRDQHRALAAVLADPPRRGRTVTVALALVRLASLALREARSVARFGATGLALKALRSRILVVEYRRSIVARIPRLVRHADVVHAHDLGTLAAAMRLADHWAAARPERPRPRVVYDSHELYVEQNTDWTRAEKELWRAHERRRIGRADLVITVSAGIADELERRYGLAERPLVIHNSPDLDHLVDPDGDVRADAGVEPTRALAVYTGGVKPGRGVERLLPAMVARDGWDLAIVGAGDDEHLRGLLAEAERAGVGDRVHVLPAVPPAALPRYLSTATIGVHPLEPVCLNHELALPNKLFDYVFAGLPVAVSDLREMAGFVAAHGVGTTFDPRSAASVRAGIDALLDDPAAHRPGERTRERVAAAYGWREQAAALVAAYAELVPEGADHGGRSVGSTGDEGRGEGGDG